MTLLKWVPEIAESQFDQNNDPLKDRGSFELSSCDKVTIKMGSHLNLTNNIGLRLPPLSEIHRVC